jgi:hypothetical protein
MKIVSAAAAASENLFYQECGVGTRAGVLREVQCFHRAIEKSCRPPSRHLRVSDSVPPVSPFHGDREAPVHGS